FIPAGAGNSQAATRRVCAIRGLSPLARGTRDRSEIPDPIQTVYPRWRGELTMAPAKNALVGGLSPLARGTL
ncbi:hypothetical protein, partial [Escherichia coli]|uniref:hypothetical protein n=1 Tax=Escherichia coli TaxID=562 RepID=UPI001BDB7BED